MKLCKDCKHYIHRSSGIFDWCTHPRFGLNPVDGTPNRKYPSIERAERHSIYEKRETSCGPEGQYFDQKEPEQVKKSWLTVLKEKLNNRKQV